MANEPTFEPYWHTHHLRDYSHSGCKAAGKISFPQAQALSAKKTSDGLALTIPVDIEVTEAPPFQITNIRAIVYQRGIEVGIAHDFNIYTAGSRRGAELVARLPAHVIRLIERVRAGGPAALELQFFCEVSRLVPQDGSPLVMGTAPQQASYRVHVVYPREAWVKMLNETGLGENIVVEIPLPPSPSPEWEPIWKAVTTARDSLKLGGDTAWKAALVECRHALEQWQKLEKEDHGPGWKAPTPAERSSRTRQQRLDNIRWDLLQCVHEAAHTPADKWTRDDAILVLATLTGLLAIRNP
jgi:hypothetical protein